ncbi:hypothetical protein [Trebonia kvetii]|uniref:hypothetical protein n=1 Tax=Trebonia kvetii TaxID=2480626 RepID=UPI001652A8EE|nr:hypothetical protein [Trebonia kvetii]
MRDVSFKACHWCGNPVEGSADGGRYYPAQDVWLHDGECAGEYFMFARLEGAA